MAAHRLSCHQIKKNEFISSEDTVLIDVDVGIEGISDTETRRSGRWRREREQSVRGRVWAFKEGALEVEMLNN